MKTNYIIRKIKAEDADQYINLANLVWRSAYKNIFPEEVFIQMESEDRIAKFKAGFAENILVNDKIVCVAEVDGKIIGFFVGAFKNGYEHFKEKGFADLQAIYIHPNYQHIGLGKKFFDIFVNELRKRNIKNFTIGVLKDNKQARKAYEKWGGILDCYTKKYVKLGVGYDEVFYTFETQKLKTNDIETIKE